MHCRDSMCPGDRIWGHRNFCFNNYSSNTECSSYSTDPKQCLQDHSDVLIWQCSQLSLIILGWTYWCMSLEVFCSCFWADICGLAPKAKEKQQEINGDLQDKRHSTQDLKKKKKQLVQCKQTACKIHLLSKVIAYKKYSMCSIWNTQLFFFKLEIRTKTQTC